VKVVPHLIYVDDSAPGAGNGASWTDAYRSLAAAMSDALVGCVIRVAQGTYKPTDDNDPYKSIVLKNGEQLLGGYAGYGAANPDARDAKTDVTTISGDIGKAGDVSDNTYSVIRADGVDATTVVDGLTITLGNAVVQSRTSGAAMFVTAASP